MEQGIQTIITTSYILDERAIKKAIALYMENLDYEGCIHLDSEYIALGADEGGYTTATITINTPKSA